VFDQPVATFLVQVDQHLRVAVRVELVAALFQAGPQLAIVVHLPVEDDLDRTVLIADRLIAAGQVDDRQPAAGQPEAGRAPQPLGVRPAVGEAVRHRLQHGPVHRPRRVGVEYTRNSAHGSRASYPGLTPSTIRSSRVSTGAMSAIRLSCSPRRATSANPARSKARMSETSSYIHLW